MEFAKKEYDSDKAIAGWEHVFCIGATSYNRDNEHLYIAKKFYGRKMIWSAILESEKEANIAIMLKLSEGKAKVVHIDRDNHVTTLVECTPETSTEEPITQIVTLKRGQNILKVVGYECKDLKVQFNIENEHLFN